MSKLGRKHHGLKNDPLYIRWMRMRSRCLSLNDRAYSDYGGRGISICKRWDYFPNFKQDIESILGLPPTTNHSLDRINNDGDYEPNNVRWATPLEQTTNRRLFKKNKTGEAGIYPYGHRYLVRPTINGRLVYLGYFNKIESAILAKERAVKCAS